MVYLFSLPTIFYCFFCFCRREAALRHFEVELRYSGKPQTDESRIEILNRLISDGAWQDTTNIITLARYRYWLQMKLGKTPRECLSAHSSVYYTCAGAMARKASSINWFFVPSRMFYYTLGAWYLLCAVLISDKLERLTKKTGQQFSANEADVRVSILSKAGRRREALRIVNDVIGHLLKREDELGYGLNRKEHETLALLWRNAAELEDALGVKLAELSCVNSISYAERSGNPKVLVRILPSAAKIWMKVNKEYAKQLFEWAQQIAEENGFDDRVKEIRANLEKLK